MVLRTASLPARSLPILRPLMRYVGSATQIPSSCPAATTFPAMHRAVSACLPIKNTDPGLLPLADNGGYVQTRALSPRQPGHRSGRTICTWCGCARHAGHGRRPQRQRGGGCRRLRISALPRLHPSGEALSANWVQAARRTAFEFWGTFFAYHLAVLVPVEVELLITGVVFSACCPRWNTLQVWPNGKCDEIRRDHCGRGA